jgi:hypothetical protein
MFFYCFCTLTCDVASKISLNLKLSLLIFNLLVILKVTLQLENTKKKKNRRTPNINHNLIYQHVFVL